MKTIICDGKIIEVPNDYELCGDCGYDHEYEPKESQAWHRENDVAHPLTGITHSTVTTIAEFNKKYGQDAWRLIIETFMARAPEFPGEAHLADAIGEIIIDLETVLNNPSNNG